jgi:thiol-disulfide isomerase/thioredoxin
MSGKKRPWKKWLAEALLVVLALLAVHFWQTRELPQGTAPALRGTLLDGRQVALEDYRGEPLLVHFWASWCPVCRLEEDTIQALSRQWPVLTVAMQSGDEQAVHGYMDREGLDFPVLVDGSGAVARRWQVRGVPVSLVLDGQGQIRFAVVGYATRAGLILRLWLASFCFNPR